MAMHSRGRRTLLLVVVGLLCAAAGLAIGVLLFGDFGGTEGRILVTTLLLAVNGALTVPAAILWDQERLTALAVACGGLAAVAASLEILNVWTGGSSDQSGKTIATLNFFLIPLVVTTALATRPLHRLFTPSVGLGAMAASMATGAMWTETEREGYLRVMGAVVVLFILLVALQPLLLRVRREQADYRLRIAATSGHRVDVTIRSATLADAVARAIRSVESDAREVRTVEVLERDGPGRNEATAG